MAAAVLLRRPLEGSQAQHSTAHPRASQTQHMPAAAPAAPAAHGLRKPTIWEAGMPQDSWAHSRIPAISARARSLSIVASICGGVTNMCAGWSGWRDACLFRLGIAPCWVAGWCIVTVGTMRAARMQVPSVRRPCVQCIVRGAQAYRRVRHCVVCNEGEAASGELFEPTGCSAAGQTLSKHPSLAER